MIVIRFIWIINSFIKIFFFKIVYFNKFQFNSIFSFFLGPRSVIYLAGENAKFISNGLKLRRDVVINVNGGELVVGRNVFINNRCSINCHNSIKIGENSLFGENVLIYDHDHKFNLNADRISTLGFKKGKIIIGSNVWVGSNVIILKDVKIGDNCVIAAGSIVTKDIPENTLFYQPRLNNFKTL